MRSLVLLRRITAVLSSALLLQLTLLASGTLCGVHAGGTTTASVHGSGMSHAAHHVAGGAHAANAAPSPVADGSSLPAGHRNGGCDMNGSSCGMPWSPGGCVSTGACPIGVSVPAVAHVALAARSAMPVVPAVTAALPLGPTYAPELPPPRA